MRFPFTASLVALTACAPRDDAAAQRSDALPACEWCGAAETPARLTPSVRIAPSGEPGEPMVISGRVLRPDGAAPAPGVVLYVYHTNAAGSYARRGDETGNARRHGYLRAWIRTDARGHYRFETVRPGHYPGRGEPAHVHATITEPGRAEYWLDDFVFEDDPQVTPAYRASRQNRGGSGIVRLARGADGVWRGTRDITLMRRGER
jgi:protocatechuate 3,4-dioxygenase beta subunit